MIGGGGAGSRVAMLPSWPELASLARGLLLVICAAGALKLPHSRSTSLGERTLSWDPARTDALRPLFTLAVLLVPYLPWLPDRVPALRLLAGPGRWVLWAVVVGQVIWLLASRVGWKSAFDRLARLDGRLPCLAIFGISLAVYGTTWCCGFEHRLLSRAAMNRTISSSRRACSAIETSEIENNHTRGDYGCVLYLLS